MNSRERFRITMQYGEPDRVPYFEEGIRKEVLRAWTKQGLPSESEFTRMFPCDEREEIQLELDPIPAKWPTLPSELGKFRNSLDAKDPAYFSTVNIADKKHKCVVALHPLFNLFNL